MNLESLTQTTKYTYKDQRAEEKKKNKRATDYLSVQKAQGKNGLKENK